MFNNQLGAIAAPRRNAAEDNLTHSQKMGRALCDWIERIPIDKLPTTGGTSATLTVNIDYDDLKAQTTAATLADGTRISAGELRRIACGAAILPRVLDGKSEILDQGRAKRLFTTAQRLAWPTATAAAPTPAATDHQHGPKPTTSTGGPKTAATPTSTAQHSYAHDTTTGSTRKTSTGD